MEVSSLLLLAASIWMMEASPKHPSSGSGEEKSPAWKWMLANGTNLKQCPVHCFPVKPDPSIRVVRAAVALFRDTTGGHRAVSRIFGLGNFTQKKISESQIRFSTLCPLPSALEPPTADLGFQLQAGRRQERTG